MYLASVSRVEPTRYIVQSCGRKLSEPENSQECKELIETRNCHPILVRLAWHDSGTYDQRIKDWPQCGGANGAIRFDPEMNMGANAGLHENQMSFISAAPEKIGELANA